MGPGTGVIGSRLPTAPDLEPLADHVHDGLHTIHHDLPETLYVDFLIVVLQTLNFFFPIEQVLQLLPVNFIERDS